MHYSMVAAPLALAAGTNAWNQTSYTTEVVTSFTTYCPEATALTHNGQVYSVTEATTLTITDCPCTISKAVIPSSTTPVPTSFTTSVAPVLSIVASPSSVSVAPVSETAVPSSSAAIVISAAPIASGIAPVSSIGASAPYPTTVYSTSLAPGTAAPVGTASSAPSSPVSPSSPSTSPFTGAGNRFAASGAGIAAVFALAAFFL